MRERQGIDTVMEKVLGIVYAYDVVDAYEEIRELGLEWVRMGICFPWTDKMFGTVSERYLRLKGEMEKAYQKGMKIMPATPGMGGYRYDPEKQETYFMEDWPDFVGEKGTEEYYRNVAATCEFICKDIKGITGGLWQCMNEIDIPIFAGNYATDILVGTARASAEGIVRADPEAKCGINLSQYREEGLKIADMVYAPGHKFGYIGDDQYFGSWQPHTVERWNEVIDALYERYQLPVLANEWGYSSAGIVKEEMPDSSILPDGITEVCYGKSWYYGVDGGHTEEVQAAYLRRGLEIFAQNPHALGSFIFCYKDAKHCYHCGESDCPAECYWGIVDVNEQPKKAYYAVKEAIRDFYGD